MTAASPKRIQRRRSKGWRMPAGAVYVGRPTQWGNPFVGDNAAAVKAFREWLTGRCSVSIGPDQPIKRLAYIPAYESRILASIDQLRGRDLVCWCRLDQPCHADVLLELANR